MTPNPFPDCPCGDTYTYTYTYEYILAYTPSDPGTKPTVAAAAQAQLAAAQSW